MEKESIMLFHEVTWDAFVSLFGDKNLQLHTGHNEMNLGSPMLKLAEYRIKLGVKVYITQRLKYAAMTLYRLED
jgi:hypothetical protein